MAFSTRVLGRNGPHVSAVGLGAMSLAGAYDTSERTLDEKLAVFDHAHKIGARFWDTANSYRGSEQTIGEWFRRSGNRDDIFLATKVGLCWGDGTLTADSSPENVKKACNESLKNLGIDTIDLLYLQRLDDKTPIEKTIEALVELKNEGKIRYLGLSECSAATLRRASAVHQISAYEVEYSLFCLDIESPQVDALNACRENGIAIVTYSPVGRGLLSGQIKTFDDLPTSGRDMRRLTPKYSRENFPKITSLVAKVEAMAAKHNITSAQMCLAWLLAQGNDVIPIPGTKTIKYLDDNVAAASIELTNEEVKAMRELSEATYLPGDRYPPQFMDTIFRDTPPL